VNLDCGQKNIRVSVYEKNVKKEMGLD